MEQTKTMKKVLYHNFDAVDAEGPLLNYYLKADSQDHLSALLSVVRDQQESGESTIDFTPVTKEAYDAPEMSPSVMDELGQYEGWGTYDTVDSAGKPKRYYIKPEDMALLTAHKKKSRLP